MEAIPFSVTKVIAWAYYPVQKIFFMALHTRLSPILSPAPSQLLLAPGLWLFQP